MNIQQLFEEHEDEYLEFDHVQNKFSSRPDVHAFMLLDILCPGSHDLISAAEHDQFYLSVNPEELEATEEELFDLHRCGVLFDPDTESLFMFA